MNYNKCEVARIGKLTTSTLEYVSFYIPKRVEGFHAEIYPDCITGEINTTLDEWKSGTNKDCTRKPINTLDNKWTTSESSFEKKNTLPEEHKSGSCQECGDLQHVVDKLKIELEASLKLVKLFIF